MKMNDNLLDLALERVTEITSNINSQPLCIYFTQEVWDYIEENCEPFMPGIKRIVLPDRFELGEK